MKNMTIGAVALLLALLLSSCESDKGRYQAYPTDGGGLMVLDTEKGLLYEYQDRTKLIVIVDIPNSTLSESAVSINK